MLNKILHQKLNDGIIASAIFLYILSLLFHWSYMSPLYHSNEWSDPNIYFTIGKAIFNGQVLYTELFDHKGPVIFFIYGLGYLISNHSFLGVFLIQVLAWTFMAFMVYRTAKLYLNNGIAYLPALIFPYFLTSIMKTGGAAEEFILVFECISLYFFVLYFKNRDTSIHNPYVMLIHGIMFALVVFCKLNLAVFWFFPITGIFIDLLLKKTFRNLIQNSLAFLGGFLIIAVPICLYLSINHAFSEFYSIYFELNRKYSGLHFTGESFQLLFFRLFFLQGKPFGLFLMPFFGIFYFPFRYIDNKIGKYVFMFTGICLYVMIFITPTYQVYYPIPFLVFGTLGIISVFAFISRYVIVFRTFTISYLIFLFFLMFAVGIGLKDTTDEKIADFSKKDPGLFTKKLYREVSKETNPTLLVLNCGLANNLFTTCQIMPNVRYFSSPNLSHESYPIMRSEQTEYIKNKRVQFIVLSVPDDEYRYVKWEVTRSDGNKSGVSQFITFRNLKGDTYSYFSSLPALKENYELCLRDTIINTFEENLIDIYELYKRKD